MTLPVFLAAHLVYGVMMGAILLRRMRAEGEVVGVPLVTTFVPLVLTAPLGAVLLRYAGGWFLHGALVGNGSIAYERFHFGFMVAVGAAACVATLLGKLFAVAVLSRERPRLMLVPLVLAALVVVATLLLDGGDVLRVPGTGGRWLFFHPAGLVSLAIGAVLVASYLYAKRRVASVMPRPAGPGSIVPPPSPSR